MLLLNKYQKKFNMFSSNKHNNNNTSVTNNITPSEIYNNNNNNNNINDCIDTNTSSDMATFIDPRLQYNMTTPVTSYNPLSSINNNNNNNNSFYHLQQQPPQQFSYGKYNGSTVSLASSINSDVTLPLQSNSLNNVNINNNILSKQFINLLIETYQFLSSDPTITPFDINNPPSGILNRVGKISLQRANSINMEIFNNTTNSKINNTNQTFLLSIIRHNLLSEIRKDGYYSRNVSLVSLPQPFLFNNNNNNNNNSSSSQLPVLKRTDTMDRLQNNIFNVTGMNNSTISLNMDETTTTTTTTTTCGNIGLGTCLNNSNNTNNFNPLLSHSSSRISSPLATRTRYL